VVPLDFLRIAADPLVGWMFSREASMPCLWRSGLIIAACWN